MKKMADGKGCSCPEHILQALRIEHAVGPGLEFLARRRAQALLRPLGQGTEATHKHALQ